MLHINVQGFYRAAAELAAMRAAIQAERHKLDDQVERADADELISTAAGLENEVEVLQAGVTKIALQRLYARLRPQTRYQTTYGEAIALINEIESRLVDELSHKYVFALTAENRTYYRAIALFGNEFSLKFPNASYELDEAGKCLALERSTAAVFHLMRIMELGIGAVQQCLSIPDPIKAADRNWGVMLRKLREEFELRNKQQPPRWNGADQDFFGEAYASLDAVRNVWRNATMHVDKKYTLEEAHDIFSAVRGFMRRLATRFDAQGYPRA